MLPGRRIDAPTMRRTLDRVVDEWNWERTWGWDYPMAAMTAARVGKPETAVDLLLKPVPKNRYLKNGHNWQSDRLPIYLPGNGGLLSAVAMMAAGWRDPIVQTPAFRTTVRGPCAGRGFNRCRRIQETTEHSSNNQIPYYDRNRSRVLTLQPEHAPRMAKQTHGCPDERDKKTKAWADQLLDRSRRLFSAFSLTRVLRLSAAGTAK